MPAVKVAECKTAADVVQVAREVIARRKAWNAGVAPQPPAPLSEDYLFAAERADKITRFFWRLQKAGAVTIRHIQEAVSEAYQVPMMDILSSRQHAHCSHARQIAMVLSKMLTTASYPKIAAHFGGRHHSTIIHACQKHADLQREMMKVMQPSDPLQMWVDAVAAKYPLPELTPDALRKQGKDIAARMARRKTQ